MKAEIKKIIFNVNGKTLELTTGEAKELKQILSDLFGEAKVVHEYHNIYNNPTYPPYYPYRGPYWYSASSSSGGALCLSTTAGTSHEPQGALNG